MPRRRIIRFQKRIPGVKRDALPATVLKEIRDAVDAEAARHGVSRSFVVAVRLAKSYGIKGQEQL